eukprot:7134108-Prymnesium_polylepis.1
MANRIAGMQHAAQTMSARGPVRVLSSWPLRLSAVTKRRSTRRARTTSTVRTSPSLTIAQSRTRPRTATRTTTTSERRAHAGNHESRLCARC